VHGALFVLGLDDLFRSVARAGLAVGVLSALIGTHGTESGAAGPWEAANRIGAVERVLRDLAHSIGRGHARRISTLGTLRDLLIEQSEIERAAAVQTEVVEYWNLVAGPMSPMRSRQGRKSSRS
jgi:hypothetical protein